MTKKRRKPLDEGAYLEGQRSAWRTLLSECLKQLGYHAAHADPLVAITRMVREREDAIAQLRMVCRDHGDNDWDENLYLGDIIEKHLANHLG